jgi:uncharacterized protein (TIGR00255 family)
MTGFGRAEGTKDDAAFTVEIRSVNHRYCDIAATLPREFTSLEEAIKKWIKQRVARGHLDLIIRYNRPLKTEYTLDIPSAKAHYQMLQKLKTGLGLSGEITIDYFTHSKDFISRIEPAPLPARTIPPFLKKILDTALSALDQVRLREGNALSKEISARILGLSKVVAQIEINQKKGLKERYHRLLSRVEELTKQPAVDPQRLAQEWALMIDRNDISEEIARLKTHGVEFQRLLQQDAPVGRNLDFLTQEISREINTIGSKANDEKISLQVVAMKCEMEKVREQVQNIE